MTTHTSPKQYPYEPVLPEMLKQSGMHQYLTLLLARLMTFMIPLGLVLAALPDLLNGYERVWEDTEFLLTLAAAVLCLGLIWLSKTRYYRFTSVLTILVAYATIIFAAVPSDGLDDLFILYFLVIPIAFSVFFLPKWGTWVTGGVTILTVALFPLFEPAVPYSKIINGPLSFFLIIVPLVGYVNHHRLKFDSFQRNVMTRYLEQMRTVYHLGHAVSRVGSMSEIYDLAMSGLLHTLPVDRTAVLLFDAHGKMQFQAWRGLSDAYREQLNGHSPWTTDTKNPAPVFVSSLEDPEVADFREALEQEGIQALAFIPLVQNGRLLGKFMLYCNQPHIFTEIEAQVAQTIASHVSLAIVRLQDMQALRESEERYRHIIDHASDLIVQVDRQGTYQFVSPSYCQLFGKSIDEVLGTHIRNYIHPDDLPKVRGMLAALIKPPYSGYLEQRSLTVKGWRWLAWHDQAILDDVGHVVAVIGVGRDITEKKEAEERLRLYARRLEILHEVERAVVTAVSQHEIMQTAVDAICDLLGCPIGAVITIDEQKKEARLLAVNHNQKSHFPVGSKFPLTQTPLLETFKQGEIVIQKGYEEIIKATGRVLPENTQAAIYVPLIAHNTLMGILFLAAYEEATFTGTWVDIASELGGTLALALHQSGLYAKVEAYAQELEARVEERTAELMEANARLSQLDQLKTKFIADVSHELRTPITNLSLYTDLLQVGGSSDKQKHYIWVLKEQTARLRRLVEGIFYMSRLDSLRLEELTCETVNLQTLVQLAVAGNQALAAQYGVSLAADEVTAVPPVWGDASLLSEMISALVHNAIQHSGGHKVTLTLCVENEFVQLTIRDDGMGIDEEDLPHVYERFYRGKKVGQFNEAPGVGLGLAFTKRIVELHNGRISIATKPHQGTAVTIQLPVSPLANGQLRQRQQSL